MSPLVLALTIVAGGVGATLRYVAVASRRRVREGARRGLTPPWRILVVNVVASFIAGLAISLLPAAWEPVAIAGFCGGLSTWSTWMTDTVATWASGRRVRALALVAAHLGYGIMAAIGGVLVGGLIG